MKLCPKCQQRGKDWSGSDPRCAFPDGVFSPDNWNCATANEIRDICYEGQNPMPLGVSYTYCDDQKYATIKLSDMWDEGSESCGVDALCLWVSWYKSRGCTEAMWLMDNHNTPKPPTLEDCEKVIKHYFKSANRAPAE